MGMERLVVLQIKVNLLCRIKRGSKKSEPHADGQRPYAIAIAVFMQRAAVA